MRSSFNVIISVDVAIDYYSYIVGELFARIFLRYIPCIYIKFVFSYFTLFGDHYIWVKILSCSRIGCSILFFIFFRRDPDLLLYIFFATIFERFRSKTNGTFYILQFFSSMVSWLGKGASYAIQPSTNTRLKMCNNSDALHIHCTVSYLNK